MNEEIDYEVETDKLISFLFPKDEDGEFRDNPDILKYLNTFGSMNIDQLYKEKKILDEEISSIDNQMRQLAMSNYKSFIHTADTSRNIYKNICTVEDNLNSFLAATPTLLSECEKFADVSSEIRDRRRRNNLILSNHTEILQILEIPQFMNACICNEHYDEALLLPVFVKQLSAKHSDIPLIRTIANDVNKSWWELMRHLVRHLSSDVTLPKCLQVVGYLRRMNVFSEVQLRLKFLQARGFWFDSLLAGVSNEDKCSHLNAIIDITRISIFNIATQYKAVFSEDEVVTRLNNLKNSIFHSWLTKKINDLLSVIEADLLHCPSSSLDSLLGQCMYFGQSFGRIGSDFRGLLIGYFVQTVEHNFDIAIRKVDDQFSINMRKFVLRKLNLVSNSNLLKASTANNQFLSPPISLLDYFPLATYCNGVLSAFNDLRYCVLIGCVARITTILQNSLTAVSINFSSYYEKENITWIDTEKETFHQMCVCFSENLIEFLQRCLSALFEPEKIAKCLAVSVSYLEDEKLGFLNVSEIKKPIALII